MATATRAATWFAPSPRRAVAIVVAIALAAGLALHIRTYWFVLDDAFISFRYARHLAAGHGLVFNPGERVEGYTNWLWVLWLAAAAKCGARPEVIAPWTSALLTFALAAAATLWGRARLAPSERLYAWIAPLLLACNRSFCVWATSGLETRLFECFVLAGLASAWRESRTSRSPPWSSVSFALAVWTRPDAALPAAVTAIVVAAQRLRAGRFELRAALATVAPFVLLAGAQEAWRLAYYHAWVPNTYYAKVDGALAPLQGLRFLDAWMTEYAIAAWLPFAVFGAAAWRRREPGLLPLVLLPVAAFVAYVVAIGGDHFEFRMLDLATLPLALLVQSGAARYIAPRARLAPRLAAIASVIALAAASALLPALSHREFPAEYALGFPGTTPRPDGTRELVRIASLPRFARGLGLRAWVGHFDRRAIELTAVGAAIRQEEHAAFAAAAADVGRDLRDLVAAGALPADLRIALHCAGAIPYYSDLWTLDLLGLCDAHVARGAWGAGPRHVAHGKWATPDYVRARGVDLEPVLPCRFFVTDGAVREVVRAGGCTPEDPCWVARLGADLSLFVRLPAGDPTAGSRLAGIPFEKQARRLAPGPP